jgi:hypothetical protein
MYRKAAEYIQSTEIVVGFVSTNSISQGEQPGVLWKPLFDWFHLKIHFAYRTFSWTSEARGKAHVHVVIIGFAAHDVAEKHIYEATPAMESVAASIVANISPYLTAGNDIAVLPRRKPLCDVPECMKGSSPTDGGNLVLEDNEREAFLAANPLARRYVRPLICAYEYLNGIPRWCLWLVDAKPSDIRKNKGLLARIEAVKEFRLASKKIPTNQKAHEPTLFGEIRQPRTKYMVLPQHSSETRTYIPFGYFGPRTIVHDSCTALPDATPYHFGVLSSLMHMAWVKQVAGRLESRYRYSNTLVYNNFPWP